MIWLFFYAAVIVTMMTMVKILVIKISCVSSAMYSPWQWCVVRRYLQCTGSTCPLHFSYACFLDMFIYCSDDDIFAHLRRRSIIVNVYVMTTTTV